MTTLDRIKNLSQKKGWSLQTLAEKAGVGKNSIYRWDTKVPSTSSLQKVAKVLNVSTDYLLGGDEIALDDKNTESEIKNPKIKILARKMDSKKLSDAQIDSISNAIGSFVDAIFDDKDDK